MKGCVAQCKRFWLSETETAIDRHVRSLRRHPSIVFAQQVRVGAEYPYPVFMPPAASGSPLQALTRGRLMSPAVRDWLCLEFLCRDVRLVHAHFATDAIFYSPAAEAADVPMLVSCHGHDVYRFPRTFSGLARWMLRRLFSKAAMVTAVSEHMRGEIISLGCPPDKVRTVRVGIDLADREFRPPTPNPRRTRFACIAGLRPKKGVPYLVEAFGKVAAVRSDAELVIVGDGPMRPRIERCIEQHRLWGKVVLTGALRPDEVRRVLETAHIYVQPSVTAPDGDREGIPATLMEAMARGLPVIATRHSGIPELVQDGVSGYLVDERDPSALAEAMLLSMERSHSWEAMGQAGRAAIERDHDLTKQTAVVEDLYEELLTVQDSAVVIPIGQVRPEEASRPAA